MMKINNGVAALLAGGRKQRFGLNGLNGLHSLILSCMLLGALTACGGAGNTAGNSGTALPPAALAGKSSFVSADGINSYNPNLANLTTATATSSDAARTIEQGDIYRVLEDGKMIANLNGNRGLQLLDISNADAPKIIGQLPLIGTPVEMYRVGEHLHLLLNNRSEYRRVLKDGKQALEHDYGASVITVDISNRAAPALIGSVRIPGGIQASRMASGSGKNALYVASITSASSASALLTGVVPQGSPVSSIQSFAVNADGSLQAKTQIDQGGWVQAIAASGERMMVAKTTPDFGKGKISLIDISSADGVMRQGGEVTVSGLVQKKENMQIVGDSLRIVSSSTVLPDPGNAGNIGNGITNHVETFDVKNLAAPKAVDHKTFGAGQNLYATTFLPDRAFFVTYLRQDPFHSFSISPEGLLQEEHEFAVSGWNDFLSPVNNRRNLIGIGQNDQGNLRKLSVSLYDISNLKNPRPLLARADIVLDYGWSEALWDQRGYSVLENAIEILADDGKTLETGLVLLPFSGWNNSTRQYQSGVQMFSFSATSLTRRGVMNHDNPVRRAFIANTASQLAGNLSGVNLSLFDITNPNAPLKKSSLTLASDIAQFVAFKNVGVRYRRNDSISNLDDNSLFDTLELMAPGNANGDTPLGTIAVRTGSTIYNVNETLVSFKSETIAGSSPTGFLQKTTLNTWDISQSANPRAIGKLETTVPAPAPWTIAAAAQDARTTCAGLCYPATGNGDVRVVGQALVIASPTFHYQAATGSALARSWASYALQVIDLSNPGNPTLQNKIDLPENEEVVTFKSSGSTLWVNFKLTQANDANGQALAKYFARSIDLRTPATPLVGKNINIPGELVLAVGNALYTKDFVWNGSRIDYSINLLLTQNDTAYLQASKAFSGKILGDVVVDGSKVLASHFGYDGKSGVTILNQGDSGFSVFDEIGLDNWAGVVLAGSGKAVFQTVDGFLLYDISQPSNAFAQAFFPSVGNGLPTLQNNTVAVSSGYGGVLQFDLNTVNLARP
jgi:hypothetical protein